MNSEPQPKQTKQDGFIHADLAAVNADIVKHVLTGKIDLFQHDIRSPFTSMIGYADMAILGINSNSATTTVDVSGETLKARADRLKEAGSSLVRKADLMFSVESDLYRHILSHKEGADASDPTRRDNIRSMLSIWLDREIGADDPRIELLVGQSRSGLIAWIAGDVLKGLHDVEGGLSGIAGALEGKYATYANKALSQIKALGEKFPFLVSEITGETYVPAPSAFELVNILDESWQYFKTKEPHVQGKDTLLRNITGKVATMDPGLFRLILENLFKNAAAHGGEDIRIDGFTFTADSREYLTLSVTNDGKPIPPVQQKTIWERGARGRNTTSEGSGIGTYIIDRAVKLLGGRRNLESGYTDIARTKGKTTFTVILPLDTPRNP